MDSKAPSGRLQASKASQAKLLPLDTAVSVVARHVARCGRQLEASLKLVAPEAVSFLSKGQRGHKRYVDKVRDYQKSFFKSGMSMSVMDRQLRVQRPNLDIEQPTQGLAGPNVRWVRLESCCIVPPVSVDKLQPLEATRRLEEWWRLQAFEALKAAERLGGVVRVGSVFVGFQQDPRRTPVALAQLEHRQQLEVGDWFDFPAATGSSFRAWDRFVVVDEFSSEEALWPEATELLLLPEELAFAQNDASEVFAQSGRSSERGRGEKKTVLDTFAELWSGKLKEADLPQLSVVWHDGQFYVSSGNRRLIVFRLLRQYRPGHYGRIPVVLAPFEESFLQERRDARGRRLGPEKLTTGRNGAHCRGAWIHVRETSQWVSQQRADFAEDLLRGVLRLGEPR